MVKKNGNKDSDERTFKDGVDVTEEVKAQEELDEIERKLDLELAEEQGLKDLEQFGDPNVKPKKKPETALDRELENVLKSDKDLAEEKRDEEFNAWDVKGNLSLGEMNKSKADAFTFGERVKSGVKSLVSDLNFKKTKAGDSPIGNLFDDLASGQFSTKETRTFSRGVSDLKEKVAAERGGTGKPIYGLYPVSQAGKQSSRGYTKAQVMPKQSKRAQKRPAQSGFQVSRNLGQSSAGNIKSTNMDFVQPLFGNPPKVAKSNRKMPNARKGNPYNLNFRF